jgi:hypothetical protein
VALVNGPVGPATYSPALTEMRPDVRTGSTLVLVPEHVLADEHGRDYVVWELRGGRVCVRGEASAAGPARRPPSGVAHVIASARAPAPYARLRLVRRAGPYALWARSPAPAPPGPCPLIAVGARANPAND